MSWLTPAHQPFRKPWGSTRSFEMQSFEQDRNYERSRGIWTNLFGGSKKNSEENSEK
jgi:hypothetical protein